MESIKLTAELQTDFHRELASPAWLATLARHIETGIARHPEYQSCLGSGIVRSGFNELRFMGPHSLVKFQFVVEVEVVSPDPLHPLDRYVAAVRYFPETADFKTESETIDTPKTRAEREREEEASRAKRREAQQARERALRLELEEFSGHAGKPALPVASDAEDGSARKRFREAVLELCISCRRPAAESVYLVERYGGVILKSLEGTRLASICAACVRADHSNVGCKLYRYWGWLPEPQAGSQVAHRAELSLEEWGYWSLVLDGVVHNHDSPLPWSDHDDVRAHIETQASKKT